MRNRFHMTIATLVALNLIMSKVAATLGLPVYLDTIGTIVGAALLPWWATVLVGAATSFGAGILTHPAFFYYIGNQIVVALLAIGFIKMGAFRKLWSAAAVGFFIAICASIVAAPVTVLVFGGVTLGSTTAINAVLMAAGQNIWQSVISGSLIIESVDKIAACLTAVVVIRRLPRKLKNENPHG